MKEEDLGVLYNVSGFYMYGGGHYDFTGEFFIDIVKHINGRIWDPGSLCDEHQVAGTIINSDKIRMEFVKIPIGMLVDIHYKLKKETKPFDSLVGRYRGNWSFNEEVIPIVEGTEGETKNFTSIKLKKVGGEQKMKKIINVNDLEEILKKEYNSDFCYIDGIEIVTKGRAPYNPEYIGIGPGRVLNIHVDLGKQI